MRILSDQLGLKKVKNYLNLSSKPGEKGRADYYLTPSHDFTQYTKDCEEKYWNKETAFDWGQDIHHNLKNHLEHLPPEGFAWIASHVLPMIGDALDQKLAFLRQGQLPLDEDALKDIGESLPGDRTAIQQALSALIPLRNLEFSLAARNDQVEILLKEVQDLLGIHRLGLFREGAQVRRMETAAERQAQTMEMRRLLDQANRLHEESKQMNARFKAESKRLQAEIRQDLHTLRPLILADLEESRELVRQPGDHSRVKELILKRQLRALKDIANHALVVEQSAIAPLTMGIIHYKRHREIQEAMTTFINDEAKHSSTFRRYLAEKLAAREFISDNLIKGASRYMWVARFMPGAGLFLAVVVEAIGAATLEFFGNEQYMPEKLFRSICKTISQQDEKRHMDLCVAMYNELFRTGLRWEQIRNRAALQVILKSVYADKTDDHRLLQAFRAFGVESDYLYRHIIGSLCEQLARIRMFVEPAELLASLGRK